MTIQQKFEFKKDRTYSIGQESYLFYLGDDGERHKFATLDIPPRKITPDEERRVIGLRFNSFEIVKDLLYPLIEDYLSVEIRRLSLLEIVGYNEACRKIMEIYELLRRARAN